MKKGFMFVLTRRNRESVMILRPENLEVLLEITILEIVGSRVKLGFTAKSRMPIHRREEWERIYHDKGQGLSHASRVVNEIVVKVPAPATMLGGRS